MTATEERPLIRQVFLLPNIVTIIRLACIPWFVYLLFGAEDRLAAAVLLAVLGATDWLDGQLARRLNQVSTLGKVLDPTADRLLLVVGIGSILIDGSVPVWIGVLALLREALVGIMALIIAALGARRIDVTWIGKTGTLLTMVAFPLFLAGNSQASWADQALVLGWLVAIPGLITSYAAAAAYVPIALTALKQGRAERAASRGAEES
jgi:cardiolipin synthase (CMP-forming)